MESGGIFQSRSRAKWKTIRGPQRDGDRPKKLSLRRVQNLRPKGVIFILVSDRSICRWNKKLTGHAACVPIPAAPSLLYRFGRGRPARCTVQNCKVISTEVTRATCTQVFQHSDSDRQLYIPSTVLHVPLSPYFRLLGEAPKVAIGGPVSEASLPLKPPFAST